MTKLFIAALLASLILSTGCRTKSGSREFTPGKGWKEIRVAPESPDQPSPS